MNEKKIFALLHQLWGDVSHPEFYWELGALVLILVFSRWLSLWLNKAKAAGAAGAPADSTVAGLRAFGEGGLKRIGFPLLAVVLVFSLRQTLVAFGWGHLSLLYLAAPLLMTWVLVRILVYVLRCVFSHGGFLTSFERLITVTIWSCLVIELSGMSRFVIDALEEVTFSVGKQKFDLWMLLSGTVTIGGTLLVALWIASLVEKRLMAARDMDGNLREVLGRAAKAALSIVALLISLSLVGIDMTALSVFSGALAVGLGFGLQKIASNYVSGFIILLDRSIRLGNLVAVDDATSGTITQITTRYTVLRTLNGVEVIIPNEHLVSNMVRNLSFSDTRVRVPVKVQVAYSTDLEQAMQLMQEAACQHPRVLVDPEPGVLLTEFADSGINLELGLWVADPEVGTGGVRSDVSLAIWKSFKENGIEIPFPQREVRILDKPVGDCQPLNA
ncbi:mechanosensitive ion channel family protein [Propionivibrio limicola]|uniref:mechanosensitive ion channel family protein n=1 Tax=Propionivibrio limicola TaxID=167645 RepID=UPI0012909163|nr:mechanosensitive ion channel domain-containing protein [Propionivibrio limicola]